MFIVRKKFKIEYAHQLDDAFSSDCSKNIHGHSGIIEIFLKSNDLNIDGMVIDFGKIKFLIGDYIKSFDHALIISEKFISKYPSLKEHNEKLKIVKYNPTAEEMARDIYQYVKRVLDQENFYSGKMLYKVRFHETDTGYAEYFSE